MKSNVLVILGHPDRESFCAALADTYAEGAERSGATVARLDVGALDFDPNLRKGYKEVQELEPDLVEAQRLIEWADHLVFAYPLWWGAMPAVLKGFLDRVFHPGWAFQFHSDTALLWDPLLSGRSARLIITSDGPPSVIRFVFGDPGVKMMKGMTLEFCGVSPVRVTTFGSVKRASRGRRVAWKMTARELGMRRA